MKPSATTYRARFAVRRPARRGRPRGTWKIAYADFVTAMMAFFLFMWIVNAAKPETREELAGYFGSEAVEANSGGLQETPAEAAERLAAELRALPALQPWSSQVRIEAVASELRIELSEGGSKPMFALGSGELSPEAERLLAVLAPVITDIANPFTIEGHTDNRPWAGTSMSNWTLSSARADAARRVLIASGVPEHLVLAVSGRADTDPADAARPEAGINRRIVLIFRL